MREPYRTLFALCSIALWLAIYLSVNHAPLARFTIPLLPYESLIPFWPWTYIIYMSAFVQAVVVLRLLPWRLLVPAGILAACVGSISMTCFILFPISYPRELFPHTYTWLSLFQQADGPGNCFPSLHVAGTILLAGVFQNISSRHIYIVCMWFWAFLISLSVLTTKQHYIIDIFGAAILTFPALWIFSRIARTTSRG